MGGPNFNPRLVGGVLFFFKQFGTIYPFSGCGPLDNQLEVINSGLTFFIMGLTCNTLL